jgi:serine/threonine protein kinase
VAPLRHRPKDAAADWHRRSGPLRVGELIDDRYEVVEVLSNGATADVCKVRHRILGRQFALKVLRTECSRDAEYSERLLREARALGAVNHPNIVTITDCGRLPSGEPYFVMEYVEGITLEELLAEQGALDVGLALEIAAGVCDALDAAHRIGIVHRDLKPDNICVVQRGGKCCVKVLDFGLARVAGQGRLTRPNTTHGTPEYMSPEQNMGLDVDGRADVYSLGVTLYEMLCGRLPFAADSYVALAHQHMYAPLPAFRRWLREDSPALRLEAVVSRCVEKDREHRYGSAAEASRALSPYRVPDRTLRLSRSVEGRPLGKSVLLKGRQRPVPANPERAAAPAPDWSTEIPVSGIDSGGTGVVAVSHIRGLRYAYLLQWAIVGCCLGTLILVLVYWLGGGAS